jgi:hypothetical protein
VVTLTNKSSQNSLLPKNFRTAGRRYLNVPFDQKDEAKKLGAQWDMSVKLWYARNGIDHAMFKKWLGNEKSFEQRCDAAMKKYREKKIFPASTS